MEKRPEGIALSDEEKGKLKKDSGIIESMELFRAKPILEGVLEEKLDPDDEINFITSKEREALKQEIDKVEGDIEKRRRMDALNRIGEKLIDDDLEEIVDNKKEAA